VGEGKTEGEKTEGGSRAKVLGNEKTGAEESREEVEKDKPGSGGKGSKIKTIKSSCRVVRREGSPCVSWQG